MAFSLHNYTTATVPSLTTKYICTYTCKWCVCACLQKWLTSLAVMCLVTPFKCYASQWSVCVRHVTALLVPASSLLISRSVLGWDEVGHDWHTRKRLRWKLRERVQRIMRRSGRTQKRNVREHVHIVQCDVCYLLMCFTV